MSMTCKTCALAVLIKEEKKHVWKTESIPGIPERRELMWYCKAAKAVYDDRFETARYSGGQYLSDSDTTVPVTYRVPRRLDCPKNGRWLEGGHIELRVFKGHDIPESLESLPTEGAYLNEYDISECGCLRCSNFKSWEDVTSAVPPVPSETKQYVEPAVYECRLTNVAVKKSADQWCGQWRSSR